MDISIIEYISFGFVAYFSLAILIITAIKEVPVTRSLAGLRAIYLMPGIICAGLLAFSGVNIVFETTTTNTLNHAANGTLLTNATSTVTNYVPLQVPFWQTFHFMIMIVLIVYVLVQIFSIIGKSE